MNLLRNGRNDVAVGRRDGSVYHEIRNGDSSLHPYPRSTSVCHAGRDLDVAVNGAWGKSSGIYPKVETVSYRNPGGGEDRKGVVHDLTASLDRMKVRMNHPRTDDHVFRQGEGRKVDSVWSRGRAVYDPLSVHFWDPRLGA